MKRILVVFLFTLLGYSSIAQESFDFRKIKWGMSEEQVLKSEATTPVSKGNDKIYYSVKVMNTDCYLMYEFLHNKLTTAYYVFNKEHLNYNRYIEDYRKIKTLLTKKYGNPKEDKTNWSNSLYKQMPENWGAALYLGHVRFDCLWVAPRTEIALKLVGEDMQIRNAIRYSSTKLMDDAENKREAEALNDL